MEDIVKNISHECENIREYTIDQALTSLLILFDDEKQQIIRGHVNAFKASLKPIEILSVDEKKKPIANSVKTTKDARIIAILQALKPLPDDFIRMVLRAVPTKSEVLAWMKRGMGADNDIAEFIVSENDTINLGILSPFRRMEVHTRAEALGLEHVSRVVSTNAKAMYLTKPLGWYFDVNRENKVITVKPTKYPKRNRRESWRTWCDGCNTELDAYSAFYHYNGMGPYCEDCIENDEELYPHKWEVKADFW